MRIRPYRPSDLEDVVDVCIRTGDAGGDATGQHDDDRLLADVFAVPYLVREPERALVVDDGDRAVGYVLGTRDTAAFAAWYRAEWLPATAGRYPAPADPPVSATDDLLLLHRRPERMLHAELAPWPAHLHIDLLPAAQRQGFGRALIRAFLDGLRADGVPGVHLGAAPGNTAAHAFYDRLGFARVEVPDDDAVWFARRTADASS